MKHAVTDVLSVTDLFLFNGKNLSVGQIQRFLPRCRTPRTWQLASNWYPYANVTSWAHAMVDYASGPVTCEKGALRSCRLFAHLALADCRFERGIDQKSAASRPVDEYELAQQPAVICAVCGTHVTDWAMTLRSSHCRNMLDMEMWHYCLRN